MAALTELGETHLGGGRSTTFKPDFRRGTFLQERSHTRTYLAHTDGVLVNSATVWTLALAWGGGPEPLPAVWSVHPVDTQSLLTHHELTQHADDPEWWTIRCNYSTMPDPVDEVAELDWGDGSIELVLDGAQAYIQQDGVTEVLPTESPYPGLTANELYPITNSAGDPFDPPPTDPEHYRVLTVTKNFALYNCFGTATGSLNTISPSLGWEPSIVDDFFARRINSTPFAVPDVCNPYPAGTVFLAEMPKAKAEYRNNVQYWATTWRFWIRARGWTLRIADMGFRKNFIYGIPGFISGEPPTIICTGGQPAQNARKLNSSGDEAEIGEQVYYLHYRIRKKADFNQLGLFAGLL